MLAFLLLPFVGGVVLALSITGGLRIGALPSALLAAIYGLAATAVTAARWRSTPALLTGGLALLWIAGSVAIRIAVGMEPDGAEMIAAYGTHPSAASMSPFVMIGAGGVALCWLRRDVFVRAWDPAGLVPALSAGIDLIVRPGRRRQLLAGGAMALLGFALLFFPLALHRSAAGASVGWVWAIRVLWVGGILMAGPAIAIQDVADERA